jgi:phosphoadenosine phosphosulfate reductase
VALIEHDLFRGRIDRVQIAIDRLKMFEPPEGYYLAYSGGKDSDTILALAKMAGVKFDAHYHLTTVDPPELVYHVRRRPEVIIDRPEMTMWQLIRKKKIPPTRIVRYCCEKLKEGGGQGRVVITGVRASESIKRSKRKMNEVCYNDPSKKFLHAVIDWSDTDVWEFLKSNNVRYCKLYDQGYKRLGCVLCPLKGQNERVRDLNRYPRIAEAYKRAIIRAYDSRERPSKGIKSGEDMFNWWVSGRSAKEWAEKDTAFWAYE